MGRIKIEDLPGDHKIGRDEMRKVLGGALQQTQLYYISSRTWDIPQPFRPGFDYSSIGAPNYPDPWYADLF